jgi:hypothetical protein
MTTYKIFANGAYWGDFEADTAEEAIQAAADEHSTFFDVGQDRASTYSMTAEQASA